MLRTLWANLDVGSLDPSFQHPCDHSAKVYVFLDVCYMLKLVRNTFADGGILYDEVGNAIRWKYLSDLHTLQEEGLRLANKLKSSHLCWQKQKMKVNLAAQSLSSSVADALDYCNVKLKLSQFQVSEATSKFLRISDRLFDICNSRNPLAKNFKAPLRKNNQSHVDEFLDEGFSYIISVTDCARHPMHSSRGKTRFIGFLVAIKSLKAMYTDPVAPDPASLKYLFTYKMCQDHLELFFAAVRSSGGCSNNPPSSHFISIYKQLLMRHQIEGGHGNCIVQDTTSILNAVDDRCSIHEVQTGQVQHPKWMLHLPADMI